MVESKAQAELKCGSQLCKRCAKAFVRQKHKLPDFTMECVAWPKRSRKKNEFDELDSIHSTMLKQIDINDFEFYSQEVNEDGAHERKPHLFMSALSEIELFLIHCFSGFYFCNGTIQQQSQSLLLN